MGLEICVLEATDDVFDPLSGWQNPVEDPGKPLDGEDDVPLEVTRELDRLKLLGRAYQAPSASELLPRRDVHSQKTDEVLDPVLVAEGRERELITLCNQGALFVIPKSAVKHGTKTVRGRFVDNMKDDRVKSRFVAAEVARDVRYDVHAGTPPLKALRTIISLAATRGGKRNPRSVAFYDIVAAFVHASIDEVVAVYPSDGLLDRGECFLLLKALYGTRKASKRWQQHYTRVLKGYGWVASSVVPGIFHHRNPAGTCGCHGDDFMAEGDDDLLTRLDTIMSTEFEAKLLGRVGRGRLPEIKFLKRKLRWHEDETSFSWSGGAHYVAELAELLGFTSDKTSTKTKTPGTKATGSCARDALELLEPSQAVTYRSAVGMVGYIVLDRPDCQFAAKEVMSKTQEPRKLDWMRLLRLGKFLFSHPELEWVFPAQDTPGRYVVFGDSDWGGSESRRSTSGTFEQLGTHPIDYSCSTQHVIALSSGEAELYATGRAAAGGLQSVQFLAEAGLQLKLEILTDSTANIGMHSRIGSGRVRHLDVKWLWTQEAMQAGRFTLKKVDTTENISDLTTKYHDESRLEALMKLGGLRYTRGRAVLEVSTSRTTGVNGIVSAVGSQ